MYGDVSIMIPALGMPVCSDDRKDLQVFVADDDDCYSPLVMTDDC